MYMVWSSLRDVCSEGVIREFENHPKVSEGIRNKRFIVLRCGKVEVYIYRGQVRDYIVDPCRFCSCYDFMINVLSRRRKVACYHVVGFLIAEERGALRVVEVSCDVIRDVVLEISLFGLSTKLRKYV